MSEAWRNSYDSWRLRGPDEDAEDEGDEEARLDAEARAEHLAEARAEEERYRRKYGDDEENKWAETSDLGRYQP